MGAFRSKPIVDKLSKDEENGKLCCATSTMQGWRVTQEDAYNFILDYDKDTAYFAVYDGHGGHEVAEYLSRNLPQFLKDMESYKEGDYEKMLIEGFLKMDASLNTPEVMAILKEIALEGADADVEENIDTLYEEAAMPVEKVLEKYWDGDSRSNTKEKDETPNSSDILNEAGCSRKSERNRRNVCNTSTSQIRESEESSDKCQDNSNESIEKSLKKQIESVDKLIEKPVEQTDKLEKATDESVKIKEESKYKGEIEAVEEKIVSKTVQNGELCTTNKDSSKSDNSQDEMGEINKGKGKAIVKRITPTTIEKSTTEPAKTDEEIYKTFLKRYVDSEEESEDSEEIYESSESDSSDELDEDESKNGVEEGTEELEEEDENDEDDEDESDQDNDDDDDDDSDILLNREFVKPGVKSGSTGVVALLKGNQLYVANVGDSRCVVCREGKAIRMSYDHKPQNRIEKERVNKAGGTVDAEDRVDGGLNMSRAFGDFFYKSNTELSQTEQMIIALPDVKTLTIDPNKDEFMVLASDGIWNVKKCQEVIDFLRPKIATCDGKLSTIIEELFDECLGTLSFDAGTDNMTLIIVKFKSNISKRSSSPPPEPTAKKFRSDSSENVTQDPTVNC